MSVEATWRITPTLKTPQPAIIVVRRPIKSAISPAIIAPKKVPAERIDVIRDLFCELILNWASGVVSGS
jgi:hypothetical protein